MRTGRPRSMEEQTVTIEKIVHGGKGLGRINGQVIFIPFTLPGETVRVRVTKKHRDYLEGQVIEVVTPSAKRIPPDCAIFWPMWRLSNQSCNI